jgi:Cytosol aminopeptidase family, N-terminal domain
MAALTDGAAQLEWLASEHGALERLAPELLVCASSPAERPFKGLLEIADWRLAGKISELAQRRMLTSHLGETLLVRSRGPLPYRNLLIVGQGDNHGLRTADYVKAACEAVVALRVASVAIETEEHDNATFEAALGQALASEERASAAKWLAVMRERLT